MPCWELFESQPGAIAAKCWERRRASPSKRSAGFGWDRYIGERGAFIGMPGFGASAPAADLYKHFGITVDAVVATAATLTH